MRRFRLFALLTVVVAALPAMTHHSIFDMPNVADGVWAIVGPMEQRSPDNLGNNATFGLVETAAGAVLIDPGGSHRGAAQLHEAVKALTDQPVIAVIDTGGQDHRWLGNGYWKERGATIYGSTAGQVDHDDRADMQFAMLRALIGEDNLAGTKAVHADVTFETALDVTIGGVAFQLRHAGQAHTPGDAYVWLPEKGVMFAGDIVYMDRMLGVGEQSNSKSWLAAFDAMAAHEPKVVVPGHGYPAPLAKARAQTRDYLAYLRDKVGAVMAAGGGAIEAAKVDQSPFMGLKVADQIAGRNAQAVFLEMEWE